ncbi:chemotaxis protein CheX [Acetobacterium carbinolicum]|jgi:chemotaxis protein CheX|uniref:chemotaxis protein CheX n=1 Tax=Acetobacterium TaxID=33951 RepID=UPI000DBEBCA3|nr:MULTISPECIES: chemotaxis protein CheX [unclassified Acetobacterium]AWW25572.1 chemotaxis protein CheX [Acetobacterium sp. KB-1]MDZ5724518.1 chemotaxis protein CheX [Acetobacterium sp. K1/6]
MDLTIINPFIASVTDVMPQLGFANIDLKEQSEKSKKIVASGIVLTLGIVGDKKGNVAYAIDTEGAKQIASIMMMGMPVDELDDMAKSAISELSNMLTANAAINFSNDNVTVDISPPTMLTGESIELSMSKDQVMCVEFDIDGIKLEINVALD